MRAGPGKRPASVPHESCRPPGCGYNAPSNETLDIFPGSHGGMDEPQAAGGHRVSQGRERLGGLLRSYHRAVAITNRMNRYGAVPPRRTTRAIRRLLRKQQAQRLRKTFVRALTGSPPRTSARYGTRRGIRTSSCQIAIPRGCLGNVSPLPPGAYALAVTAGGCCHKRHILPPLGPLAETHPARFGGPTGVGPQATHMKGNR